MYCFADGGNKGKPQIEHVGLLINSKKNKCVTVLSIENMIYAW